MIDPFYNPVVPSHVPADRVHDFNIYAPLQDGMDPYQSVRHIVDSALPDLFWTRNNGGHWVALRSGPIEEIARDPVTFSCKRMLIPDECNFETPWFVPSMADPPEHSGYRAILNPMFSPRKMEARRAEVAELTGQLIDELRPRGECEFMTDFAQQMPVMIFLRLLDLPQEDRPRLIRIAHDLVNPPTGDDARDAGIKRMFDYLRPFVAERLANPGDDVLSQIVNARHQGRPMDEEERIGVASNVLQGGLDTVTAVLGWISKYLAEAPAVRRRLNEQPDRIPAAVEEILRRHPPTTHTRRLAADTRLHGLELRRNDQIAWISAMYNLDEQHCPHAMDVDIDRKRIATFSFGIGTHICLGIFLARMELAVFVKEWLARIPDFSIKPGTTLSYRTGSAIAIDALPLIWPK